MLHTARVSKVLLCLKRFVLQDDHISSKKKNPRKLVASTSFSLRSISPWRAFGICKRPDWRVNDECVPLVTAAVHGDLRIVNSSAVWGAHSCFSRSSNMAARSGFALARDTASEKVLQIRRCCNTVCKIRRCWKPVGHKRITSFTFVPNSRFLVESFFGAMKG